MNKSNLELKHYCKDFKSVRSVLRKIGAKKETIKKQKDYFFNLPSYKERGKARFKLRVESGEQILVYYERPFFKKGKDTKSEIMLYKVQDKALLDFLKDSLGCKAIVEKKREVWRKGFTVFHLDTVKGVGGIFEIELQKKGGDISPKDKEIFKSYQDKLLPLLGRLIKGSNLDLVQK